MYRTSIGKVWNAASPIVLWLSNQKEAISLKWDESLLISSLRKNICFCIISAMNEQIRIGKTDSHEAILDSHHFQTRGRKVDGRWQ